MEQAGSWRETLRGRLRERWWDVRDWIDFRPDPSWWFAAALIAVLVAGAFALPMLVVAVILAVSVVFAFALLCVGALGIAMAVSFRALIDVLKIRNTPHRPRSYSQRVGPMLKSR